MLLLVVAVVVGLLACFALRSIAAPLSVMLLAAFVWTHVARPPLAVAQEDTADTAKSTFASPYPITASEREVCTALEEANARFTPMEARWHEADDSDRSNDARRQLLVDAAHKEIEALFSRRNADILAVVSRQRPQASSWVARLSKIESTPEDFGKGTKNYIVISGDLPCSVPTTFTSKEIEGTPEIMAAMAKLNAGDYVVLSAGFVAHDLEAQGPAAAIEWGGILWGPFGGLWPAAFRTPAFQLDISEIHRG